jgi:hypothetical protein
MIHEGMKQQASLEDYEALEDDGCQYLNDTGDGDAEQQEIGEPDIGAEVYAWNLCIYKHDVNSLRMYIIY